MDDTLYYHINKPSNDIGESLTTRILAQSDSLEYHRSLDSYKPTPLIELQDLAAEFRIKNIYLKDESYRFNLNAFKSLGASYAIFKLLEKDPLIETFSTATDGNHGRAVAWAAALSRKNSRIYVPGNTVTTRLEAIESEGAVVERFKGNYEETCDYARIMASGNGWTLVQDGASEGYEEIPAQIMAGYLTHFHELEDSIHTLPKAGVDFVFLQSGVGSWPAAAAWYYLNRYGAQKPRLVLVEPTEAAGLLASFKTRSLCSPTGNYNTIMAGLNCGKPSATAWDILKNTADAVMAIDDTFTEQAVKRLYSGTANDPKVTSGESGAAGLAGFLALMTDERYLKLKEHLGIDSNSKILFFNTEGATDPVNFQRIIDGH